MATLIEFDPRSGSDDIEETMNVMTDNLGAPATKLKFNLWVIYEKKSEVAEWLESEGFDEHDSTLWEI